MPILYNIAYFVLKEIAGISLIGHIDRVPLDKTEANSSFERKDAT